MKAPSGHEVLGDQTYVTLLLRLRLDQRGRLIGGELVNTTDTLLEPFAGEAGLHQVVRDWLRRREQDGNQSSPRAA